MDTTKLNLTSTAEKLLRGRERSTTSDNDNSMPPASVATPSPPESLFSDSSSEHLSVSTGTGTVHNNIHHNGVVLSVGGSSEMVPPTDTIPSHKTENQDNVNEQHPHHARIPPSSDLRAPNGTTAIQTNMPIMLPPQHPLSSRSPQASPRGGGETTTNGPTPIDRTILMSINDNDEGIDRRHQHPVVGGSTVTASSVGSSSTNRSTTAKQVFPTSRPTRESVMRRLSDALMRRSLTMIDLSQRDLWPSDARLVKLALLQNASLSTLKLGYNNLGDEGVCTLASGIATHSSLSSLDIGFNNIGNEGCTAIANAMLTSASNRITATSKNFGSNSPTVSSFPSSPNNKSSHQSSLQTLYLAGNSIGEEGAQALADSIRGGCRLKKLHMTGNRIGPDGVRVLMEAIIDSEISVGLDSTTGRSSRATPSFPPSSTTARNEFDFNINTSNFVSSSRSRTQNDATISQNEIGESDNGDGQDEQQTRGLHELFLGGTSMGHLGCAAVAKVLEHTKSLRVLSLANCELTDDETILLAEAITKNQNNLPIESLQLSFNEITCKGIEPLVNSFMALSKLRELRLDNNRIEGVGAEIVSNLLGAIPTLTKLDVGFNAISGMGMRVLMKSVAESSNLVSLSISGNKIDTGSAKAVAYALAHNFSLKSFFLDHCAIGNEGQKHITAGIVSNSRTSLQTLTGFGVGDNAVSLGLPDALGHLTNEQVLVFILMMWQHMTQEQEENSIDKELDPLHMLPEVHGRVPISTEYSGPLDGDTVVAVAKRAFQSFGANIEDVLARSYCEEREASFDCPLSADAIILEANGVVVEDVPCNQPMNTSEQVGMDERDNSVKNRQAPPIPGDLFVRTTTPLRPSLDLPTRKKKIVEWLCRDGNINHLNQLAQLPFNSSELYRMHQHFFSKNIQENWEARSNGSDHQDQDTLSFNNSDIQMGSSTLSEPFPNIPSTEISSHHDIPLSAPVMNGNIGTMPILKRKVSYRHLHEANFDNSCQTSKANNRNSIDGAVTESVSKIIEDRSGSCMQPKFKRARRSRTRISFVPRIKEKLDSFMDSCHTKALVLMRQLFYVEKSLLNNRIYPLDGLGTTPYLVGTVAADAEMILLDMV